MFCLYTYLKISLFLIINMTDKEWICNATKDLHQDQYLELLKIITLTIAEIELAIARPRCPKPK